ncbi:AraC family transcriptional regulator [Paenibacillus nasutitermitis]|uniref:AraC family transcriptional regulator n=1 Tax=Paenibacillus nasutitermitis TaxID=1652958 RepID=A0A916Z4Q3_9BACL|nr:AraC family transcriptional regulator [Paenibacillus nasutitermitis]GGD75862.1 AraC family transcriptional regulator [Paenibacillus nasutitermitis]
MARPVSYTVVSNPVPSEHGELYVLFAGESQTRSAHRIGPKVYSFYLMHHVLSGSGTFHCAGGEYELKQGQSFLIPPEQLVSYVANEQDPWRYRWIAFNGRQAPEMAEWAGLSAARPVIDTGSNRRIGVLFRSMERTFRQGGSAAHLRAIGYLNLLFGEFSSAADQLYHRQTGAAAYESESIPQQLIRYLSAQYAEPVSIERMAETMGYNRAYLSRVFKRHTGMTPVTFLLKLRLDKARQLLRERQELTTQQIAASVGLQDPLYFSKQFRRYYGLSPSAYREEMRGI